MVALNSQPDDAPKAADVEWCRHLIRITKNGAVWGIPRSGTTFRIDKDNNRLVLVIPGNDDGADFAATKTHFACIGWDVVTEEEARNAQKKNTE